MGKSFKDQSRLNWEPSGDNQISNEQIIVGCLQRIADNTEISARNYQNLFDEKEKYKRLYYEERAKREARDRSIISHKSNYTRLKNRLEAMKNND